MSDRPRVLPKTAHIPEQLFPDILVALIGAHHTFTAEPHFTSHHCVWRVGLFEESVPLIEDVMGARLVHVDIDNGDQR